jgi:hypothetical protein
VVARDGTKEKGKFTYVVVILLPMREILFPLGFTQRSLRKGYLSGVGVMKRDASLMVLTSNGVLRSKQ